MSSLPTGRRWQHGAKFGQKRRLLQCFAPFKSAGFEHPGPFCKKRPQLRKNCFWTLQKKAKHCKSRRFWSNLAPCCHRRPVSNELMLSCTFLAKNTEKADVFSLIWLHVAICSLLTTSPCYLPPFLGKTLKPPTFMRFFPWLKLIRTSPCPPETSGFTHFFGGPSAGRADLLFSEFSVPFFEIEIINMIYTFYFL